MNGSSNNMVAFFETQHMQN